MRLCNDDWAWCIRWCDNAAAGPGQSGAGSGRARSLGRNECGYSATWQCSINTRAKIPPEVSPKFIINIRKLWSSLIYYNYPCYLNFGQARPSYQMVPARGMFLCFTAGGFTSSNVWPLAENWKIHWNWRKIVKKLKKLDIFGHFLPQGDPIVHYIGFTGHCKKQRQ